MQIPKFIKDIKKYFMYEGSATPTTQDDLQAYMKNEHETLECLVDGLWQPETEYQEGHIVRSPNMPKGIEAKVKAGGYSATNEPDWKVSATEINDGSVVWEKIARFNDIEVTGDVTGTGVVDNNGKLELNLDLPDKVTAGTVGDTTEADLGSGATFTVPYLTVDKKGRVIDYKKRNLTLPTIATFGTGSNINVTGSVQPSLSNSGYAPGRGDSPGSFLYTAVDQGLSAGNYTLQILLQQLVNKSHTHSTKTYSWNCNCYSGDGGCFIEGRILTDKGYVNIKELKVDDFIIFENKKYKVSGIAKSKLGKRKAIAIVGVKGLVLTDDHLIKVYNGVAAYSAEEYRKNQKKILQDNKVFGTYDRKLNGKNGIISLLKSKVKFLKDSKEFESEVVKVEKYDENTVTYLPIVEGADWCIANGIIVACAKEIK